MPAHSEESNRTNGVGDTTEPRAGITVNHQCPPCGIRCGTVGFAHA